MEKLIHYVGLDVHKETIAPAIAPEGAEEVRSYGNIPGTLDALDKMIKKIELAPDGSKVELRFAYEAGPCGYVIHRHLTKRGFFCAVAAPSEIPKKPGDRVKTDRRDAIKLARLFRAKELTFINVPDAGDEAIRDLVRARDRAVGDQRRGRQRVKGFLLRYGFRYNGKTSWTEAHLRYLAELKMSHAAQQIAYQEYVEAVTVATERVSRLTIAVENALPGWRWEKVVRGLMCLRGVAVIHAMTLVAEVGDFTRFESPTQLMHYFGLTPSENSSGGKRRLGAITKAGNGACRRALVEAAHNYRISPRVGAALQKRQENQPREVRAIALKAQQRLNSRHKVLLSRSKKPTVVITALARELCGFVWAIACQIHAPHMLVKAKPEAATKPGVKIYQLDPNMKLAKTKPALIEKQKVKK